MEAEVIRGAWDGMARNFTSKFVLLHKLFLGNCSCSPAMPGEHVMVWLEILLPNLFCYTSFFWETVQRITRNLLNTRSAIFKCHEFA